MNIEDYKVEVEDTVTKFRFRIVCKDGRATKWCWYSLPVYMDGFVAASPYHVGGQEVVLMTADEFCARTMAGVEV